MALSTASHMLVVPNRSVSIYKRLWCCYEAFLAWSLNKTITLPPPEIWVESLARRCAPCLICMLCTYLFVHVTINLSSSQCARDATIVYDEFEDMCNLISL